MITVLCKSQWMGIILKALNIFLFLILFISIICGKMLKQSTGLIWLIYHFTAMMVFIAHGSPWMCQTTYYLLNKNPIISLLECTANELIFRKQYKPTKPTAWSNMKYTAANAAP